MSGLVAFTGPPNPLLLRRMIDRLSHRGSCPASNIHESTRGSVAVCEWEGWSPPGKIQTGIFASGKNHWAFSGFAFRDLPESLIPERIAAVHGSYALAYLDTNCLTIARDAHGSQSLFYGRLHDRWLIATEPKCITQEEEFEKQIRPASAAQYLACSFSPTQQTMLENLFQVPAGHLLKFEDSRAPSRQCYFQFEEFESQQVATNSKSQFSNSPVTPSGEERHWVERTRNTIEQVVADRMPSDTPLVFLSGGLDSSIVAAEVAKQSPRRIKTFSIHFGRQYTNELAFAQQVAERVNSEHFEVFIDPNDFVDRIGQMIWHLDEPIGDPITQPNFELAAFVSQHGDFVFNGEGGDPLFGGPKNLPMLMQHWYGINDRPARFREDAYLVSYRRSYDEWAELLSEKMRQQINPDSDLIDVLTPYFETDRPRQFLNKLMTINIRLKGANLILPKVDRMLAAHKLTPLSPLFDERLTQLSFEMPTTMKLRLGVEKYVLKKAYQDDLPSEIIERPKSGMRVPVYYWFKKRLFRQSPLRKLAKRVLKTGGLKQAGIFDPDQVRKLLNYESDHAQGRFGMKLWMLLTFEIWRQTVIEGRKY